MKAEAPRTHHFVPTHLLGYAVESFHGFPNIVVSNFPSPEGGDLDLFWRVSGSHTSQVMYCQSDTVPMMNTATHATGQELIEVNFFGCWIGMLLKWLVLVVQWIWQRRTEKTIFITLPQTIRRSLNSRARESRQHSAPDFLPFIPIILTGTHYPLRYHRDAHRIPRSDRLSPTRLR